MAGLGGVRSRAIGAASPRQTSDIKNLMSGEVAREYGYNAY